VTPEQVVGLTIALLVMATGLAGSVLPGLPSTPLVLVAAVAHRLYFDETGPSNAVLIILAVLTGLSLVLDFLASMVGARKLGATGRGLFGAVTGGIIGIFFGPPGILVGPFLGALVFELIGGRAWREAARAGAGAVLGLVGGAVAKVACCVAMITLFTADVIMRSVSTVPPAPVESAWNWLSVALG
jgi:hypothetical protein